MNVALQEGPKGTRIYLVPGDKVTLRATRINYRNPSWAYVSRYLFPRIYIRIFAIYIFTGPAKKEKKGRRKKRRCFPFVDSSERLQPFEHPFVLRQKFTRFKFAQPKCKIKRGSETNE